MLKQCKSGDDGSKSLLDNEFTSIGDVQELMTGVAQIDTAAAALMLAEQLKITDEENRYSGLKEFKRELAIRLIGGMSPVNQRSVMRSLVGTWLAENNEWVWNAYSQAFSRILKDDKSKERTANRTAFDNEISRLENQNSVTVYELKEIRALKNIADPLAAEGNGQDQAQGRKDYLELSRHIDKFSITGSSGLKDVYARQSFDSLIKEVNGFYLSAEQKALAGSNDQELMAIVIDPARSIEDRFGAAIALGISDGDIRVKTQRLLLVISNPDANEKLVQASMWALSENGAARSDRA